jgi:hypothetical protein
MHRFGQAILRAPSKALAQRGEMRARMAQRRRYQFRLLAHHSSQLSKLERQGCSSR